MQSNTFILPFLQISISGTATTEERKDCNLGGLGVNRYRLAFERPSKKQRFSLFFVDSEVSLFRRTVKLILTVFGAQTQRQFYGYQAN